MKHKFSSISPSKQTLKSTSSTSYSSSLCEEPISNTETSIFTVKIISKVDTIYIGLASSTHDLGQALGFTKSSWSLNSNGNSFSGEKRTSKGKGFEEGSIVKASVNKREGRLTFDIDGEDSGIVFESKEIREGEKYFGVSIF